MKDHRKSDMKAIWAISGRLGWSSRMLHTKLIEWGFGKSLSALDDSTLKAVRGKIEIAYEEVKNKLDDQGKYMYFLMKEIGWTYNRVNKLLVKRYNGHKQYSLADNWRKLDDSQKRGVINTLKNSKKEK
jgi:hypothetical protein